MKRTLTFLAFVLTGVWLMSAAQPPLKVTVEQLLATPKKFVGKRIDVTGYYRASLEDSSLLANARVGNGKWSVDNAIWLEPDIWDPRYHPHRPSNVSDVEDLKGRLVRVIGVFHYRYRPIKFVENNSQQRPSKGYGCFDLWERAISDITYFRPAR